MGSPAQQRRNIPPLIALRAFEAAGRYLSLTKAADELCVTQGAVSRQIRVLEEFLQRKLFDRHPRGVVLTEFGNSYFLKIKEAFSAIEDATPSKRSQSTRMVTLNVMQSLALLWLLPLLPKFRPIDSSIELRIITSMEPVDVDSDDWDIAIRLGKLPGRNYPVKAPSVDWEMVKNWRGVHAEFLAYDVLTPVCSPKLLDGAYRNPFEAMENSCLLHNVNRPKCWQEWFASQGMDPIVPKKELTYGHFFTAIEAASQGQGFAILPSLMLADLPSKGLTAAFEPATPSSGEYYLLCREARANEPSIRIVMEWLLSQAQALHHHGRC